MGSQADRPRSRSLSDPVYPAQEATIKDIQSPKNDGMKHNEIKTEHEFTDWYDRLEGGLLDAGYEEYQ